MPLYDYSCEDCGPFREWRSMSEAAVPAACPSCGDPAPRAITAPFIANMDPNNRIAHQRNERSAHEPREVVKPKDPHGREGGHAHPHRHGSHDHSHGHGRPWMIGH